MCPHNVCIEPVIRREKKTTRIRKFLIGREVKYVESRGNATRPSSADRRKPPDEKNWNIQVITGSLETFQLGGEKQPRDEKKGKRSDGLLLYHRHQLIKRDLF